MCQYKPCVLWFQLNALLSVIMVLFCLLMWMYTGDYYPSFRYQVSWYWSLLLYMYSVAICIICSIMLYKEIPSRLLNRLCLGALFAGVLGSIILVALIWPRMTRPEFSTYVYHHYELDEIVPRFMQYFQSRHKCCGITNYVDYINLNGTRLVTLPSGALSVVFDVPRSCCFSAGQKVRTCGQGIPLKNMSEIVRRLNSNTTGCYDKFTQIVYEGAPYQITVFHDIYRTIPIFQIFYLGALIGIYWFYYSKQINRVSKGEGGPRFTSRMARIA